MKKPYLTAAGFGIAAAALLFSIAPARAESDIVYHGGKKTYDRKIEQAAIRRVAEKIGDLRGSLDGIKDGYIVLESEMKDPQSSRLGFPVIREPDTDRQITTGSVRVL
jgi:hypothetical protein